MSGGRGGAGEPNRIVLGTRRSALAREQTRRVADRLRSVWPDLEVEVVRISTEGDRVLDRPLPEIGGKGLFTAELERALLGGEIDLAVHSLKDLPTDLGERFEVLGVPEREDPRDVLLRTGGSATPEELPEGSVVGTSSLRRRAQLLARRPDCTVESIRGNVGTRVEKMEAGEYDAVVLAAAGLHRLGLLDPDAADTRYLEPPGWLPAPGQGAIGVEGRAGDAGVRRRVRALADLSVRSAVAAERALLAELGAGCLVPIGALGTREEGRLRLVAVVLSGDGSREVRARGEIELTVPGEPGVAPAGDEKASSRAPLRRARELGREVARELRAKGADEILAELEEDE